MEREQSLTFEMPRCHKHFFKGHKWWCKKCDRVTELDMEELVHSLWEMQGAVDRIVKSKPNYENPNSSLPMRVPEMSILSIWLTVLLFVILTLLIILV